jgi:Zn-dependent protease
MGHALVARARGMRISGITLFLFGGVSELGEEPPSAPTEFLMAIAGPVVSLILSIAFGVAAAWGLQAGWSPPIVLVCGYLGMINGLLLLFNLIPAFPLDGGRVLRSILWAATGSVQRATFWASQAGQLFAWLLIAWGFMQFFTGHWLGGIWTGLIGLFLNGAAQSSYRQVVVRSALHGEPLRRFMHADPIAVPPTLDLQHWVEDFVYRYHRKTFPVVAEGHLLGWAETQALAKVPRSEWDRHTVGEVMRHDLEALTISPDADALEALNKMRREGVSRLLVTEGDRLIGIITLKDLLRILDLKLELGSTNGEK